MVPEPTAFALQLARVFGIDDAVMLAAFEGLLEHRVKTRAQVHQVTAGRHSLELPDELSAELACRVRDYCRLGNRQLEKQFGIDLSSYGYAT